MIDEDLKKAFQELQFKTNETRTAIANGENLKKYHRRQQLLNETTIKGIKLVDADSPFYRSVGRMFLLTDRQSEIARHETELKHAKDQIEAQDKKKEYLEKSIAEAENNLREMIQSRR